MEQMQMSFPDEKQPKKRAFNAQSKAAYESIKENRNRMYSKIILGMEKLGIGGNFEAIAVASGLKTEQVQKRMSELVEMGIVYNTGITNKTSSGRSSMIRQLEKLRNNK